MNVTVFSENMKKFRLAKKYTQEEVAEKLGVTAQSVSRWECGTTLPDVLLLPEIAELYGVIVDDLFKKQSVAYENYAQRLSALYERIAYFLPGANHQLLSFTSHKCGKQS